MKKKLCTITFKGRMFNQDLITPLNIRH